MNMHGIITPIESQENGGPRALVERARTWLWEKRIFALLVLLPIAIVAGYLFLIASDQYESEAHFLVRRVDQQTVAGTGMSQALSMVTGASAAQNEAMSVADYLTSHDVCGGAPNRDVGLVATLPSIAARISFSRLRQADPTPENLLRLLSASRSAVRITIPRRASPTLKVHSFRPRRQLRPDQPGCCWQLGEAAASTCSTST